MAILKLKKSNPKKEIAFELEYLTSLTTKQRFQMMIKKTQEIRSMLKNHGHRKRAAGRTQDLGDLKYLLRLRNRSKTHKP